MEEMLGGATLTYLGHATFRISTPAGEQILIDPWIQENSQVPDELKNVGELDTMLITHGHFDHFDDVIPLAQQTGATAVANFEIFSYLQGKGVENAAPLHKGGSIEISGVRATAVNAHHSSSIAEADGTIVYAGEPLGLVIELESGFRLYHAGDTSIFGDMRLIGELYRPSLALLPIGDRVVMSPYEAAHATRLLGVSHVVPIHYGTFPFLPGTPEEFQKYADDIPGLETHVMQPGDSFSS
jgi:L-ascorbate metabolism protein UlaG (beta-lactamase superfamily)